MSLEASTLFREHRCLPDVLLRYISNGLESWLVGGHIDDIIFDGPTVRVDLCIIVQDHRAPRAYLFSDGQNMYNRVTNYWFYTHSCIPLHRIISQIRLKPGEMCDTYLTHVCRRSQNVDCSMRTHRKGDLSANTWVS